MPKQNVALAVWNFDPAGNCFLIRKYFPNWETENVPIFPDREVVARLGYEISKNTIGPNLCMKKKNSFSTT